MRTIPGAERIADQISRPGPSIRLNDAFSQAASSRTHFIAIIETAFRVARETQADGETILDAEDVKPARLADLYPESCSMVAILTTIAQNATEKQRKEKPLKKSRS